jgi:hypothetical protein
MSETDKNTELEINISKLTFDSSDDEDNNIEKKEDNNIEKGEDNNNIEKEEDNILKKLIENLLLEYIDNKKDIIINIQVSNDNYELKLTNKDINILLNILKINPKYIDNLNNLLRNIINNELTDLIHILNIHKYLKELYEILFNMNVKDIKKGIDINTCISIYKYIIYVFTHNNSISNDDKNIFMLTLFNIIDSSSDLLTLRKKLKTENYICKFFNIL